MIDTPLGLCIQHNAPCEHPDHFQITTYLSSSDFENCIKNSLTRMKFSYSRRIHFPRISFVAAE